MSISRQTLLNMYVQLKSKESYQDAINQLPICCIDVFVFNPQDSTYLLVLRKDSPAKGVWWLPGGRLYKGETFFKCSIRKCREEVGLDITPVKAIYSAATLFPDSAWSTQTHTVNQIIFAQVDSDQTLQMDRTCADYQWKNMQEVPHDLYVRQAYEKALKTIKKRYPLEQKS